MKTLTVKQLLALRMRAQRVDSGLTTAMDVARWTCGLQAQDVNAALLSFRARSRGLTAEGIKATWFETGALVRTWCMRGTLHMVARDDLRFILPLFGPEYIRKTKRRYEQLGLSEDDCLRAVEIIGDRLDEEGALTRKELAAYVAEAGIETEGQAIFHLLRRAGLTGVLCYGPYVDGAETFILLDLEVSKDDDVALWDELVLRYIAAYGPARPEDMAKWAGLSVSKARQAFERVQDQLTEVQFEDELYWLLADQRPVHDRPEHLVKLLPVFDTYLLGYENRDLILEKPFAKRVHPGGGLIHPSIMINGKLAGTWKLRKQKRQILIEVKPFTTFSAEVATQIEAEAADIGRFLEQETLLDL